MGLGNGKAMGKIDKRDGQRRKEKEMTRNHGGDGIPAKSFQSKTLAQVRKKKKFVANSHEPNVVY